MLNTMVVKMINHDREFVHLHIHRCAGASVERFFNNPYLYDHRRIEDYIKQYGEDAWEDYYTFAFIRNPWAKVVSHYFWRQQKSWWLAPGDNLEFREWVRNFDDFKENLGDKNEPQLGWLSHNGHKVDKVIKVSDLDEKWPEVCEDIGIEPKPLPKTNSTKHKHYSIYYDNQTRDIVANWYADDIRAFDFRFDDLVSDRLESLGYLND